MLEKTMDYVALDLETTGLSPRDDMIIEIGAVKVIGGSRVDKFSTFVNPNMILFHNRHRLQVPESPTGLKAICPEYMQSSHSLHLYIFPAYPY